MPLICHTILPGQFPRTFENKNTVLQIEGVSIMLLELNESVGIDGDVHSSKNG